ncbi:MAG TPA: M23 family metallopeptidase [Candidatus Binatia bacterium]|jgi:murein DD-endopeptidase MepM/ murein hydrolase activator NlpD|nr:M23 family metallopeptidase [Candidatus Binatia bacterium]
MKAAALLSVLVLVRISLAADFPWTVSVRAYEVFQGGVAEIRIEGKDLLGVRGFWADRELPFFLEKEGSCITLIGVDLEEKPGAKEIRVQARDKVGKEWVGRVAFAIKEKPFPQEKISVSPGFDRIDEATQKRIEKERRQMAQLWNSASPTRLWEKGFLTPIASEITSPFGFRRIVNGLPRAPHTGVDLKAALGTEVIATNHGRVVLRQDFFFNGKSLVLDHGAGLYTMYFHLQNFAVEEGAQVRKGELIGWTGMTGRVTGPHLHWGARLNGARIDPFELLAVN